jgi:hypothetical protein
MREIEFRGKLKNSINNQMPAGTWIYGGYYFWRDGACMHEKDAAIGLFVYPETVGQYTGLEDKNGKKIFEGDVIEYKTLRLLVRFSEEYGCFTVDGKFWMSAYSEFRIIGNIHDNPELLNGKEGAK